ncbi:MAG: cytochrome c biogenesis protein CcsA, partial [Desulfovibrionaceae bacterium]|nr:cytochrome c biogenesis protein CcsA [Desulfovibrionaceae bacterium]
FLSLGLMALAFGAGVLFLYLERKIKAKTPLSGFRKDFPALTILDRINAATTVAGFPLYTAGMVAGLVWAGSAWGATVTGDPKEIVSLAIWALYALLFHMRLAQGRRGRKPALLAILLFALCAFSFLVVNSYMDTHHSFIKRQ